MNEQRIAIITDSGTDVPRAYASEHDVRVVPLRINYSDGSSFQSGVDITSEEVARRFEQEIPKTSLPSPQQVLAALEGAKADGYVAAVVVTISAGLSATNQTCRLVAGQMEDFPVTVVDSKSIGMMAGMVVRRAVELVESGVPFSLLDSHLRRCVRETSVFFSVKSLEYLYRGGRINGTVYRLGNALNIKPVLKCDDAGYYVVARKARGWNKALDTMVSLCSQQANQFAHSRVGICCSSNASELFDRLEERLRAAIPGLVEVQRSGISPDLLVHTGPDLVGMGAQAVEVG